MTNDYRYIMIPFVIIYTSAYFTNQYCKPFDSNKKVKYQPPSYVFSIVWPLLLIHFGFSWNQNKTNPKYLIILSLLTAWMFVYLCLEMELVSFIILLLSIYQTYGLIQETKDYFLLPLCFWLSFAAFLNWQTI